MIKMKIKDDGSTIIFVNEYSTDKSVYSVEKLLRSGNISKEDFTKAEIDYDCSKGLDCDEDGKPKNFPLKVSGNKKTLLVTGVTAGYGGTGPHGTLKILDMLGFGLSEEAEEKVLTKPIDPVTKKEKTVIKLFFYK